MSPLALDVLLRGRSLSVRARCLALHPCKAALYPRETVHRMLGQLVPCVCGRTTALPGQQSTPDLALSIPPQNSPRWRSPRHTLPNRLMRSHCNRLTSSWSCRKRMVSVGGATRVGVNQTQLQSTGLRQPAHAQPASSPHLRTLEPGSWLGWHKD